MTAFERAEQPIETLRQIYKCTPPPSEVLVHVDATDNGCEAEVRQAYPAATIIKSDYRVGPGGARNRLIESARHDLVASFDDDSYPLDRDYFKRALLICNRFPDAAIVGAALYHRGEAIEQDNPAAQWTADFCGGACIYRRSAFLQTRGYVPIPVAYGMEEVDLALRLHAAGRRILTTQWLRVFHDNDRKSHNDAVVTANSIANTALLAYLRYPFSLWWLGFAQCANRVLWLLRHGRRRGVVSGVMMIPAHFRNYHAYKMRLSGPRIRSYLLLRRSPVGESF